ncbi:MAG: hypothetical protein ACT4PW_02750 [Acidimicrobiia bacterium]
MSRPAGDAAASTEDHGPAVAGNARRLVAGLEPAEVAQYLVGLLAALIVAAAVTTIGYRKWQDDTARTGSAAGGSDNPGLGPDVLPGRNQVIVRGMATAIHLEGVAGLPPLATPLAITTPERGGGSGATITGVTIDESPVSIEWDAGVPFQLEGDGGKLLANQVVIDISADATVLGFFNLDPVAFIAGTYTLNTPVAIGDGTATNEAVDQVTFETGANPTVTFRGGANTVLNETPDRFDGVGNAAFEGELVVEQPDGTEAPFAGVNLPDGPYSIRVTPVDGGFEIEGTLQGDIGTR